MNQLNSVENIGENQKVILRLDLDIPLSNGQILDNGRLKKSISTVRHLLSKNCQIAIIGHLGRPTGIDPNFSLRPVYLELISLLGEEEMGDFISNVFVDDFSSSEKISQAFTENQILFFENLRFYPSEKEGNIGYLEPLFGQCQAYVNDAFALIHRSDASIILNRNMPTYYGFDFVYEYQTLESIKSDLRKPVVFILGGAKVDKLDNIKEISAFADKILIGGKLPNFKQEFQYVTNADWANFSPSGFDIDDTSIDRFGQIIATAGTIIWAGAMGKYEDDDSLNGTKKIAEFVSQSSAKKVAAGGDTIASLKKVNMDTSFDFLCEGGGAGIAFFLKDNLPAVS